MGERVTEVRIGGGAAELPNQDCLQTFGYPLTVATFRGDPYRPSINRQSIAEDHLYSAQSMYNDASLGRAGGAFTVPSGPVGGGCVHVVFASTRYHTDPGDRPYDGAIEGFRRGQDGNI